ncbi:hypothetical protein [Acinetobacter sp. GSS19]|uniref:hypothetical protein n=1 Tax=Acinetobacter sp. GSS19 TaxID=3020716 RepID=UPI002361D726|nr:hypothetical protein [Acinetobacter sp. GSS19]
MYSKTLMLGLIGSLFSLGVWAEPPVQPGDTLESLSKVKITTSTREQASLPSSSSDQAEMVQTSNIAEGVPTEAAEQAGATNGAEQMQQPLAQSDNAEKAKRPYALAELPSSAEQPINLETAPEQPGPETTMPVPEAENEKATSVKPALTP